MDEDEIVRRLIAARGGGPRLTLEEAAGGPADAAQAYAIQARVAAATGAVGGFKTGRRLGEPQTMAPIFRQDMRESPAIIPRSGLDRIGIELEVGFRIDAPLPDPAAADFAERARACLSLVPVLEIVHARLASIETAPPMLKLADNQVNGGLVVGEPRRDWRDLNLTRPRARLAFGSEVVLDGEAEVPGGEAFATFCALAGMIGAHCGGLIPGHVVITGSLNGLSFVEPGVSVRGWIDGLGEVAADFSA